MTILKRKRLFTILPLLDEGKKRGIKKEIYGSTVNIYVTLRNRKDNLNVKVNV